MKKSLIIIPVTMIVLVIAYFAYDLVKPMLSSPCESIFQQTSLRLGTKMEIIKATGELFIGRQKIQELTERSQIIALNLKTCCIVFEGGKLSAEQFLICKSTVEEYENQMGEVLTHIKETQVAKEQGKTEVVKIKINQINEILNGAEKTFQKLRTEVLQIQNVVLVNNTEKQNSINNDNMQKPSEGTLKSGKEQEPNNTPKEANSFTFGTTVSAEITDDQDQDYFKFMNPSNLRDLVKVHFENLSTTLAPHVTVYDYNKVQIGGKTIRAPGANIEFSFTTEPNKEYYLQIQYYYGSGKYKLSMKPENAYDKHESNDDAFSATSITMRQPIIANILDRNDTDWYKVTGIKGNEIIVRFENLSTTLAPHVTVYDYNKSKMFEKDNRTPGANLEFSFTTEPNKEYYLLIKYYEGIGKYKLVVDQGKE